MPGVEKIPCVLYTVFWWPAEAPTPGNLHPKPSLACHNTRNALQSYMTREFLTVESS